MISEDLRRAAARYQRAARRADETRDHLHTIIRHAASEGMSVRAIAELVGLSFQRVAQITTTKETRRLAAAERRYREARQARLSREQGDGGACLDKITAALDAR